MSGSTSSIYVKQQEFLECVIHSDTRNNPGGRDVIVETERLSNNYGLMTNVKNVTARINKRVRICKKPYKFFKKVDRPQPTEDA